MALLRIDADTNPFGALLCLPDELERFMRSPRSRWALPALAPIRRPRFSIRRTRRDRCGDPGTREVVLEIPPVRKRRET